MKVDSIIREMRAKASLKEKIRSDLKLYEEIATSGKGLGRCQSEPNIDSPAQTELIDSHSTDSRASLEQSDVFALDIAIQAMTEITSIDELSNTEFLDSTKHPEYLETSQDSEDSTLLRIHPALSTDEFEANISALIFNIEEELQKMQDFVLAHSTLRMPEQIYADNNLAEDIKNDIFIIDKYRNSLPDNITEKAKHKSVLDILKAFNISIESLEADAIQKKALLNDTLQNSKFDLTQYQLAQKQKIQRLQLIIVQLNAIVKGIAQFQKEQQEIIKLENTRIDNALNFLHGKKLLRAKGTATKPDKVSKANRANKFSKRTKPSAKSSKLNDKSSKSSAESSMKAATKTKSKTKSKSSKADK